MKPRIGLVHAVPAAIPPVQEAFAALWPEALPVSLLDDSLTIDLNAAGGQNDAIRQRIMGLGVYHRDAGAQAVLYTCSAFGSSIDLAKSQIGLPTLKPDEAMIDEALDTGGRIGLLATFSPAVRVAEEQFVARAEQRGIRLDIDVRHVPGAAEALKSGDGDRHDSLIAEAAADFAGVACVALAQFSMARARAAVQAATDTPVLTSPESAVTRLKGLVGP